MAKEVDSMEFKKRLQAGKYASRDSALKMLEKVAAAWTPNEKRGAKIAISKKFGK